MMIFIGVLLISSVVAITLANRPIGASEASINNITINERVENFNSERTICIYIDENSELNEIQKALKDEADDYVLKVFDSSVSSVEIISRKPHKNNNLRVCGLVKFNYDKVIREVDKDSTDEIIGAEYKDGRWGRKQIGELN